MHYYSGIDNIQDYGKLVQEVKSAADAPHSWAAWKTSPTSLALAPNATSKALVQDVNIDAHKASHFVNLAVKFAPALEQRHKKKLQQAKSKGLGKTVALDEAGYQSVAALEDDQEMADFMRRVIGSYDCKIENDGAFMGIVPWFSGTTATQNFQKIEETLLYSLIADTRSPWVSWRNSEGINGDNADLDFYGYTEVAVQQDDAKMMKFARRLVNKLGVKIVNEDGFAGVIHYYSGIDNIQDYDKLVQEVKSAANAPHSWAAWKTS